MSETVYTITSVDPNFNDWDSGKPEIGVVRYFDFEFEGTNGISGAGSFGRKVYPDRDPDWPNPGDKFTAKSAEPKDGGNHWKFKVDQYNTSELLGGAVSPVSTQGTQPPPQANAGSQKPVQQVSEAYWDEKDKRIAYAHGQNVAATLISPISDWESFCQLSAQIARANLDLYRLDEHPSTAAPQPQTKPTSQAAGNKTLDEAKQELLNFCEQENIERSTMGEAIKVLTGHDNLELIDIPKLAQIKNRALDLHIPF